MTPSNKSAITAGVKITLRLGKPLVWDEAALERLSAVTPEDVALAAEQWRQDAPGRYRRLLDAAPAEDAEGG